MGLPYCGENIVLFVGKLTAFKGVGTLLRAAHCYERLAEDEILTLIVGDGNEREQLEMLSRCLNLKKLAFSGTKVRTSCGGSTMRRMCSSCPHVANLSVSSPWRPWHAGSLS